MPRKFRQKILISQIFFVELIQMKKYGEFMEYCVQWDANWVWLPFVVQLASCWTRCSGYYKYNGRVLLTILNDCERGCKLKNM